MIRPFRLLHAAAAALLVAGCGSSSTGTGTCPTGTVCNPGTPTVVSLALTQGTIVSDTVSFWAVKGQDRSAALYFRKANGDIERLVRLKVPGDALLTRPDGRTFAPGDSILITIRIPDLTKASFDFQPSGLRFNPATPAEMELEYGDASNGDLNGDGVVDSRDADIARNLGVWLQEAGQSQFFRVETEFNDETLREIEAKVLGFTRYAIAY